MPEEAIGFKFHQLVSYRGYVNPYTSQRTGIIKGKLKDMDCYVVAFKDNESVKRELTLKFGLPIRHLELEWGSWKGTTNEFILPADELGTL